MLKPGIRVSCFNKNKFAYYCCAWCYNTLLFVPLNSLRELVFESYIVVHDGTLLICSIEVVNDLIGKEMRIKVG